MNYQIESKKLIIKDIFSRWYKIPNYQRPYVWEKDQIVDLLDDISYALRQDERAEYFLGSIVFQTHKEDDEYIEDNVLDGQQRLTTLLLLTATIRDLTSKQKLKDVCKKIIFEEGNKFNSTPERIRIIFDIREEVKDFVNKYIKEENGTVDDNELRKERSETDDLSIKNMVNAILEIKNYFKNERVSNEDDSIERVSNEGVSIEDFFMYLNKKVIMIYVASENLEDAFRMFTILNNRGVKLRNSDILKADNLNQIEKQDQNKYALIWEDTENYFEDFDVFLSYIRTILVKDKARLNLYDDFNKNIYESSGQEERGNQKLTPLLARGKPTIDLIKKYKKHYDYLFNKKCLHNDDYRFGNLILIMKEVLPSDFWIPPLLRYYDKFEDIDLLNFLEKLDNKFSYDWIVTTTPTDRIKNMNNIIKAIDVAENSISLLNKDVFNINTENLMNILKNDIYGCRFAKYILYKIDYLLGETDAINVPPNITIEHILPKNPQENSQWCINFSEDDRKEWTNKIGNLVLISRRKNASQGRLEYKNKKEKYFTKNIEVFRNSVRVLSNNDKWTKDEIKNNQRTVLEKIQEHYEKNINIS